MDSPVNPIVSLILVPLMLIGFTVEVVTAPFRWLANVIRKEEPVQTEIVNSTAQQIIELNVPEAFNGEQ